MNIKVSRFNRTGDHKFCADCTDLPGSPPVGYGKTPEEAIGSLIVNLDAVVKSAREQWGFYLGAA